MRQFGVRVALCAPVVVSLIAGCSSSGKPTGPVTTPAPTGVVPQSVANDVNARSDVKMPTCKVAAGGWSAGGTVTNSTSATADYAITVFFTDAHATDLSYASTTVQVAAGQSKPWTATAKFKAPKAVLCVLRGVART